MYFSGRLYIEISRNLYSRLASPAGHIRRTTAAGEGDDQIRFAFVQHPLVSNRASGASVSFPVRRKHLQTAPIHEGVLVRQRIGTSRPALSDGDILRQRVQYSSGSVRGTWHRGSR